MIDERRATQMRRDLIRLAELGQTLNAVAATAERRNPNFTGH